MSTVPVVAIWLGVGRIMPGVNAYDLNGSQVYTGFGELLNVPAFQQLMGGVAQSLDLSLSGVSQQVLDLAATTDAPAVKLKPCVIGFAIMDQHWVLLGPIHWSFRGTVQFLRMQITGGRELGDQMVRSVTLRVASLTSGVGRRGSAYWTDQDQQLRYPGDRGCERTVLLSEFASKNWPPA